jgi:hypothetical protein
LDNTLVAIDEFHHVSAEGDNILGQVLKSIMNNSTAHIVAMTGSYFRGDSVPVLMPEDEAKFTKVTYSYYQQLNGYDYLKSLGIGYHFYQGKYTDSIMEEIHRVLTDQGQLLISTPNLASWFNRIALLFGIQPAFSEVSFKKVYGRPGSGIVGHLRLFTRRALKAFVEDNGFHNSKIVGVPFPELPRFVRPLDTLLSRFPSIAGGLVMRADKRPT